MKPLKINCISLGCAKNLVDAENLLGILKAGGHKIVFEGSDKAYDVVIINTCGFINDAKEESIDVILQNLSLKQKGLVKKVIVMGCLSQRYKTDLNNYLDGVDAIFGVNEISSIASYFKVQDSDFKRHITTPTHYAYLKIAEGCNQQCAFCAIPKIRGSYISQPIETLVNEAAYLAQCGVKELNIIAQDTTYYGLDLYKKRRLSTLLEKISEVKGIEWIRLNYTYPNAFPIDVLELMASEPKMCNYIDIPLQHISDKLLKTMKRGIDKAKTYKLIEKIRAIVPDVAIRSSFIVGFPNETNKDFQELYGFVEEMQFDRLGVFTYSHEEDTPAFSLKDKLSKRIKNERFEMLMALQQGISQNKNSRFIGQTLKVLIDYAEDNTYIARSVYDAPEVDNEVVISTDKKLQSGGFYDVKINGADAYTLFGSY